MFKLLSHTLQRIQPWLLAVVAPSLLALLGFLYMGHVHGLLVRELQRSLEFSAAQGASIISARLEGRLMALSTLAAHPVLRDREVPLKQKLNLASREVDRRDLLRVGLVGLDGEGYSSDGRALSASGYKFFSEARKGSPYISSILETTLSGAPVVVHSVPVRNEKGHVAWVLFATENTASLREALNVRFSFEGRGEAVIVDGNGIVVGSPSLGEGNFLARLGAENPPEAIDRFHRQMNQPLVPMVVYTYKGNAVYMRTARIAGSNGWSLVVMVPVSAATSSLGPMLNLSLGGLVFIVLLLLCCGLYIVALRRGYLRQRGFTDAAIHAAGIYQLEVDASGAIYSCNALFRKRLGWEEHAALPRLQELSSEAQRKDITQALDKRALFAQRLAGPRDTTILVQWHVLPGSQNSRRVLLGTDFSEREQAVEQQRAMTAMRDMQNIFDNIPFPMALFTVERTLSLANRCLITLVGEEFLRNRNLRFGGKLHEGESETMNEAFARAVSTKASVSMPHSLRLNDGTSRSYVNTQTPLLDESGEVTGVVSISVEVTDSLRVQELLTQEVQRLRSLLDSSPVGVIIAVKGLVRFRNLRARQMVGLEVGSKVFDVPLLQGDPLSILGQLEKRAIVRDVPFTLLDPQQRLRHLLLTVSRTQLEGERGTLVWAVDVTQLKDAENQLILARDTAEAATRAKSDFLATMSHEIRTPMNAVLGFVHLFERSNLSKRQLDYLEKISISATGLLRIINDILDFSKVEAGKLEIEQVPFLLSACIDASHSIMAFSAREKGLSLVTTVCPEAPAVIFGDRQRLNQVLINLLNNAVKFTEHGTIHMDVTVRESFEDGSLALSFCVRDTGIGMTEEQIERIFQPFTQADASTSRKFGGTGLGLVISRRLVQLMGGDIEVVSDSAGTAFSFTIRVQPGRQEDVPLTGTALVQENAASMEGLRGVRVLVAEDNLINQEIVEAMLQQWGIQADIANDGQEAVDMALRNDYVLVFMDMQMPGMDGLEATRVIRAHGDTKPALRELPIVAMTANAMLNDRRRCLEAGMNDHLAKPLDPEEMRRQLLQWIRVPVIRIPD